PVVWFDALLPESPDPALKRERLPPARAQQRSAAGQRENRRAFGQRGKLALVFKESDRSASRARRRASDSARTFRARPAERGRRVSAAPEVKRAGPVVRAVALVLEPTHPLMRGKRPSATGSQSRAAPERIPARDSAHQRGQPSP